MNIITKHETSRVERCPYLGLHDDDSTSLAYASPWNTCYRAKPPAPVSMEHQAEACLCPAYVDCAVLLASKRRRLPRSLRGKASDRIQNNGSQGTLARWVLLAALIAILLLLFYGQLFPF